MPALTLPHQPTGLWTYTVEREKFSTPPLDRPTLRGLHKSLHLVFNTILQGGPAPQKAKQTGSGRLRAPSYEAPPAQPPQVHTVTRACGPYGGYTVKDFREQCSEVPGPGSCTWDTQGQKRSQNVGRPSGPGRGESPLETRQVAFLLAPAQGQPPGLPHASPHTVGQARRAAQIQQSHQIQWEEKKARG